MPLTRHVERHFTSGEAVRDMSSAVIVGGVRIGAQRCIRVPSLESARS
jgi:hypothetical protein